MRIAVVHNRVTDQDAPDARDVVIQADVVSKALSCLGHETTIISCSLDLEEIRYKLVEVKPDLVFNLVEDLGGYGRLIHLFPFLLDALGIAYSGSPAEAIFLSSHKTMAKERMLHEGLPTPAWAGSYPPGGKLPSLQAKDSKWIIKSLWEHASVGLDAGSVLKTDSAEVLAAEMRKRCAMLGGACFAEEFIDGREFNLSLLAGENGPEVLPAAEIIFEGYTPEMIRIVDYQAKWEENSYAYTHTTRRFDFTDEDHEMLKLMRDIARHCWQVFGLAGYARIDFRVDRDGHPYILEINANPCLSPDAGFAAAVARAGVGFDEALTRIVADAKRNRPQQEN
ncbi:MAG: ATP-grasp domain-containing protein [Desulfobulbaceae bacterium]|nr:ATP-grasp domain-containing protein [Desulfobulbaceae bacterium]